MQTLSDSRKIENISQLILSYELKVDIKTRQRQLKKETLLTNITYELICKILNKKLSSQIQENIMTKLILS